ncbi:MarR family transcriptional regulator [Alteromonadaceae bacterium BrNp21-10]|nr:MarR family transcriptional regulator [Alteromonadaceae bacterium BrNp21-10]
MTIPLASELVIQFNKLQTRFVKRIDAQLSVHGISYTEYMVMYYLNGAENDSLRRVELAEFVGLSASGITRMLMPMQKMGLVQKDSSHRDARVSLVKLTLAGKSIFNDAQKSFNHTTAALTRSMTDKQQQKFLALTQQLFS